MPVDASRKRRRPRRDWGRAVALALCMVFALVGVVPLGLGLLVRTARVRAWAASETSKALARELGVSARYEVHVEAWPLAIGLANVVVDASDGGSPFLQVERMTVRPRAFSLLAGKLDVGDVEIVGPRVRLVVEQGELTNLRLPKGEAPKRQEGPTQAPFSSVAITDAHIDAVIEGVRVTARQVDVDVSSEEASSFEVSLRVGPTHITRTHPFVGREDDEDAVDEDTICRLDTRLRYEPGELLVRRLTLLASADFDPDPGTAPSCDLPRGDWRSVEMRLGALRIGLPKEGLPTVSGRVQARIPAPLAHRLASLPHVTGSVELDAEVDFDGRSRLPRVTGRLSAETPGIDGKVFSKHIEGDLSVGGDAVRMTKVHADWADGQIEIAEVRVEPFTKGIPLTTGPIDIANVEFPGLLRDLGTHPQAHVGWSLYEGKVEHMRGTLAPLSIEGPMVVKTRGFEIADRPIAQPNRVQMFGVKEGVVRGTFMVKPNAVVLSNYSVDTPRSHLRTTVSLGFKGMLDLEVAEGSKIDLAEVSPVVAIPFAGEMTVHASGHGTYDHPKFDGDFSIAEFAFGGFAVGDIESGKVAFEPLVLDFTDLRLRHGTSRIRAPKLEVAFDKGHDVLVDADVDTREAPHLSLVDLFEVFHFDKDPRFSDLRAVTSGTSHVHYALGGPQDACGGGKLEVHTQSHVTDALLFDEHYDDGDIDLDFVWDDQLAGAAGMQVDIRSAALRKGGGSVMLSGTVRHGGVLKGNAIASGLPIGKIDAFGAAGRLFDGTISGVANVGGTVDAIEAQADLDVSRMRIGPASLPASRLHVAIEPSAQASHADGARTRCGNARSGTFDRAEFDRDLSAGVFRVQGSLFDGQVAIDDLTMTRQRHKLVAGKLRANGLDLGTLANMVPGVAFTSAPPTGKLTASLELRNLPMDDPKMADASLVVQALELARGGREVKLTEPSKTIVLKNDELDVPELHLTFRTASGLSAAFVAGGHVHKVVTAPELDAAVRVEPIDLAKLSADLPQIARASGAVDAELHVQGPIKALRYNGSAHVHKGELAVRGSPLALSEVDVDVDVGSGEVRLTRATAKVGGGTIDMKGHMPVRGLELGTAAVTITARGVKIPAADGIQVTTDADLEATYKPGAEEEGDERNLPDVKGTVALTSFSYTRPITMSVNLGQLTGKAQRTAVETYDPAEDVLRFNVTIVSPKPLRLSNNLVDMQLQVDGQGIVLSGTNQRFGARGMLRVLPDSKLKLRSSEFEVREGWVRFEDASKIAPKVDVRAQSEYRRYASTGPETTTAAEGAGATTQGAGASGSNVSGQWRLFLHAHGDVENLKVDLTSDPPLSQEDILLLMTVGMTRAELDRGLASSLGETVGLEALSSITGADKAVKNIVPLIDEFRFGSGYSSHTGRTEPNVTLGKRITDSVRANVTTGLTENRDVRSGIEWKLNKRMSVQGSYDNANDVSSSSVGNVGADLRWHLEFE